MSGFACRLKCARLNGRMTIFWVPESANSSMTRM